MGPSLFTWSIDPAWIRNHIDYEVWDEIIYAFPNFNGAALWSLGMDASFRPTCYSRRNYVCPCLDLSYIMLKKGNKIYCRHFVPKELKWQPRVDIYHIFITQIHSYMAMTFMFRFANALLLYGWLHYNGIINKDAHISRQSINTKIKAYKSNVIEQILRNDACDIDDIVSWCMATNSAVKTLKLGKHCICY